MSTQKPLTKINGAILLLSGAYLFFVTLVIAPYLNFMNFSSVHTSTKLVLVTTSACIALLQLFFLVPRIPRAALREISTKIKYTGLVSLVGITFSFAFSSSVMTSLFGMFTHWEQNFMIYLVYVILLAAWYVYFILLRSFSLEKSVFHTLMVLALVVAITYSIGEYYLWGSTTGYDANSVTRISLGFRNPLLAAYFLGMLWSYSVTRFLTILTAEEAKRWVRVGNSVLQFVLFIGISLALLLTYTRSAWIAAGLTIITIAFTKFVNAFIKTKSGTLQAADRNVQIAKLGVAVAIICAILVSLGYVFRNEIARRNTDLLVESSNTLTTIAQSLGKTEKFDALVFYQQAQNYTSMDIRLLEWKWGVQTWLGSVKNFLFGMGPDAGFFEMPKYRDPIFNNFPTDAATKPFYVRNLYINFLMQFGIIATGGIVALGVLFFKRLYALARTDLPTTSLLIGFFAQGLFYYPSHIPTVLMLFGLAYLLSQAAPEAMLLLRQPNNSERFLLLLTISALLLWLFPIAKAELLINRYSLGGLPDSAAEMARNARLPINNNVLKRFLVYHYAGSAESYLYLDQLSQSKDVDDLRIAGDSYYLIAQRTEQIDHAEKSIETIKRLLSIDATLPATWDSIGLRYLSLAKFDDAQNSFLKAIELKPDYWYAYLHLGEVSRQECKPQEAIEWYQKAEQFVPSAEKEINEAKGELANPRPECR